MPQVPAHRLTYCTNVHPGETWQEVRANVRRHVLRVKARVSPHEPFPVGLWLSERAAREAIGAGPESFGQWCRDHGLYVATLNGFPFGGFHGPVVKQGVYEPDWRSRERARYTTELLDLLAAWLPPGAAGSASTVPVGFFRSLDPEERAAVRANLVEALEHADRLGQRTGKDLVVALEPEPGCCLETARDVVRFVDDLDLPGSLARHLGVCYDACHQAVEFEDPAGSLGLLGSAGIPVAKVQASAGLALDAPDRARLLRLSEPRYLHQVVVREGQEGLLRFADVPEAADRGPLGRGEWRVHYHVPVFLEATADGWRTTRPFLEALLPLVPRGCLVEVETYTWDVLPRDLRAPAVEESIARELEWVRGMLAGAGGTGPTGAGREDRGRCTEQWS